VVLQYYFRYCKSGDISNIRKVTHSINWWYLSGIAPEVYCKQAFTTSMPVRSPIETYTGEGLFPPNYILLESFFFEITLLKKSIPPFI